MQEKTEVMNVDNFYQDSEISLFEIWSLLMKRKKLIISIFGVSLLLALCYLFLVKPVYESYSMIRIGQVGQVEVIENPYYLVKRITEKYKINDDSEGVIKLPKLVRVDIVKDSNRADTSLINLYARAHSAESARDYLTKVIDELLVEHNEVYNNMKSTRLKILASIKQELQRIDSKIDLYDQQISSFKGRDDSLIALLVQQKLGLEAQRTSLERQITDIEMYLSEKFTYPTNFIRKPTLPISAVNFRPVFSMGVAGMLGLMLGVFLAFVLEYIKKEKGQLEQVKSGNKGLPLNG